jgi:hypothetical protein
MYILSNRSKNKDKQKKGNLPEDMMSSGRYLAAVTVGDVWICYPWEAAYVAFSNMHFPCWILELIGNVEILTSKTDLLLLKRRHRAPVSVLR